MSVNTAISYNNLTKFWKKKTLIYLYHKRTHSWLTQLCQILSKGINYTHFRNFIKMLRQFNPAYRPTGLWIWVVGNSLYGLSVTAPRFRNNCHLRSSPKLNKTEYFLIWQITDQNHTRYTTRSNQVAITWKLRSNSCQNSIKKKNKNRKRSHVQSCIT